MGKYIDLTGHKYGLLSVLGIHDKVKNYRRRKCVCECGTECVKCGHQMRAGHTVSCGCEQKRKESLTGKSNALDLTGEVFSRLTVLRREGSNEFQKALWLCRCECGIETLVATSSLMSGNTTSCGCFHKEMVSEMFYNLEITDKERWVSRNRELAHPELHLWRKAVYERDGYSCQVCGCAKSGSLVAHHKDGWNICPKKRMDVDNGVTACADCHEEFHKKYGYGGNTERQWQSFVTSREEYCA